MNRSFILMWAFWLVMLTLGLAEPYLSPNFDQGAYFLTTTFISTGFLFVWFLADAQDSNYSASTGLKIAVIAIGVVAIPYYIIKVKGLKRFGLSFVKFLGFVVIYFGGFIGVEYLNA